MVIEKVNYQKLYPAGAYLNERIGFEASVYEGEDLIKALFQLKEIADKFHKESNPQLDGVNVEPEKLPEEQIEPKEKRILAMIVDISKAEDFGVLKSYQLISKSNPVLQAAYDLRKIQLQKQTENAS